MDEYLLLTYLGHLGRLGANDCWLTADMTSVYCSMRPPYGAPPSTGTIYLYSKHMHMPGVPS
jgi:hypothetical protein